MELLSLVKVRCGIPENITVYDEAEIIPLIRDAIDEIHTAGVPERLAPAYDAEHQDSEDYNPRVVTCIVCYVQMHRGNDRTDTQRYREMYREKLHKLMLEGE